MQYVNRPPSLVVLDAQKEDIVVELFEPMYYSVPNAITYDIVIEDATSVSIPDQIGRSSLVIYISVKQKCQVL